MLKIVGPWSLPSLPQKRVKIGRGQPRRLRRVSDGYVAVSLQMSQGNFAADCPVARNARQLRRQRVR